MSDVFHFIHRTHIASCAPTISSHNYHHPSLLLAHVCTEIITICCLVHFFIVVASVAQPDGTAPMAEFANVFDPSGDPQKAMVGMMKVSVCDLGKIKNESSQPNDV